MVAPRVGTAVVWRNWLGDDLGTFHASSTHGACPPKHGKKCVIQQWISRKHKLELRDERLAALFLAGANAHYQAGGSSSGGEGADTPTVQQCMMDASANEGRAVPRICSGEGTDAVQLDGTTSGPYRGVGALRTSGGFAAELPPGMVGGGVTASLWARDLEPGTTVLSLGPAYLKFRNSSSVRLSFELRAGSEVREMKVFSGKASETWFWFSLSLGGAATCRRRYLQGKARCFVYDPSGHLRGRAGADFWAVQVGDRFPPCLRGVRERPERRVFLRPELRPLAQ